MVVRKGKDNDVKKLVKIYQNFFPTHNIFSGSDKKIILYLKQQVKEHTLLVFEDYARVIKGALFLVNFGKSADATHMLWKFRHFSFETERIALQLLLDAEKRVQKASKTGKIELTIAENEQGLDFYKSQKYTVEGRLSHHYRYGETCFILAKSFP